MKNKIIYTVTWKYMKRNKKRTAVTFLGILFMVLLMTCVFSGKETAINYLEEIGSQKNGKWHISIYDITDEQKNELDKLDYITETALSVNYGFTEFDKSQNANIPYMYIKAYSDSCFDWMNIKLKEGRFPENENEILISRSATDDGSDLHIGDKINARMFTRSITGKKEGQQTTLPFNDVSVTYGEYVEVPYDFPYYTENDSFTEINNFTGFENEYTVSGITEIPSFEKAGSAGYIAITRFCSKDIPQKLNISFKIDETQAPDSCIEKLYDIAGECTVEINDFVMVFSGKSSDNTINKITWMMTVFFTALIIFSSVILIYNVFSMSFDERSKYLGMLSSIGASGRQKRSSVYFEAFSVLISAIPFGIISGLLVVKLGMAALKPFIDNVMNLSVYTADCKVHISLSLSSFLAIIIVSIFTVLISAFLPALRVSKIGAIESVRGNLSRSKRKYKMNRFIAEKFGAEGILANGFINRQKKKTRSITAAVSVFICVVVVVIFSSQAITRIISYRLSDDNEFEINSSNWDYIVESSDRNNSDNNFFNNLKERIKKDPDTLNVAECYIDMSGEVPHDVISDEYWSFFSKNISSQASDDKISKLPHSVNILAVDNENFEKILKETDTDPTYFQEGSQPAAIVLQSGELEVSYPSKRGTEYHFYQIEKMTDLNIGESIPVSISDDSPEYTFRIAGYTTNQQIKNIISFHSSSLWLITDIRNIQNIIDTTDVNASESFMIKFKNANCNAASELQRISNQENTDCYIIKTDTAVVLSKAISAIINILLISFVSLTSIICLLNLYNSIRGRIQGKRNEFAVMESVGMTRKQIRKMLFYECTVIVLKSIIISAIFSVPLIYFISDRLCFLFGYIHLPFPFIIYTVTTFLTSLVCFIITFRCYSQEKISTIITDIRI